jgi:hypothetical protein
MTGLAGAVGTDDHWLDWLKGDLFKGNGAAAAAGRLAAENDSTVHGFTEKTVNGFPGYWVEIKTQYTVGKSIIPGTEGKHATAHAVAVIQPRCDFDPAADPKKPVELNCDGQTVNIDPGKFDPVDLPDPSVLFSVHLAE